MKKALSIIGLIAFGSLFSQNIAFDKLYGNSDPANYYLGHYPVPSSDGLDINWYGGIRLSTSGGLGVQILNNGNVGIGTADPQAKLEVAGDLRIKSYSPIIYLDRNVNNGGYVQGIQTRLSDGSDNWFFGNLHADVFAVSTGGYAGAQQFVINRNGNAALQGKFEAKEIKVTLTPTADFVFEKDYALPKLEDVEKHIKENKHLPEIASAEVMEKEGVNVGEFQIKLLQKIEELTLYSIEQNKQIKNLQEENKMLKQQSDKIEKLEKKLEKLLSEKK
ncbi:hypothetical protein M2347_000246 [Chryseobacterium sp. H1D6B]|uniref:hypothetical protein n=1 Tax=Chryseobacterium sp. H1D6B TaxID=2940588 RepID=UPI00182744F5|nr:hypothetical protein [Chryseobacterium sp. H1D6B]MDH6250519.1 hypothetical protein [Chryseobacterium sp. H1D6B]